MDQAAPPISNSGSHPLVRLLTFAPLRKIFTGTPVPLDGYRSIPVLRKTLESHPWQKFWFIRSEDRLIIEPKPLLPFRLGNAWGGEFFGEVTGEEERASIRGRFVFPFPAKMAVVFLTGICLVVPNAGGISFGSLLISYILLLFLNLGFSAFDLTNGASQRVILDALHQSTVP